LVLARATGGCCLRLRRGPSVIRTGEEGFRGTPASRLLAQDLLRPVGPLVASQVCLAGGVSCVVVLSMWGLRAGRGTRCICIAWRGNGRVRWRLHVSPPLHSGTSASLSLSFSILYIIHLSFVSWRTISNLLSGSLLTAGILFHSKF
jgi:hypothetical protein